MIKIFSCYLRKILSLDFLPHQNSQYKNIYFQGIGATNVVLNQWIKKYIFVFRLNKNI